MESRCKKTYIFHRRTAFPRMMLFLSPLLILSAVSCRSVPEPLLIPDFRPAPDSLPGAPVVLFIPGWQVQQGAAYRALAAARKSDEISMLKQAFPGAAVRFLDWEFAVPWAENQVNAIRLTLALEEKLLAATEAERRNLILIGHSTGAKIAIRAMAYLKKHRGKIRRGIFLAAALPRNDRDLRDAVAASSEPAVNIFCPEDAVLTRVLEKLGGYRALGARGAEPDFCEKHLLQYRMEPEFTGTDSLNNHWAVLYLKTLRDALAGARKPPEETRKNQSSRGK